MGWDRDVKDLHRSLSCQTDKLRTIFFKEQRHPSRGAVPVFGYDQLCNVAGNVVGAFVVVVPVQEHDDVCVLFQGAAFP